MNKHKWSRLKLKEISQKVLVALSKVGEFQQPARLNSTHAPPACPFSD